MLKIKNYFIEANLMHPEIHNQSNWQKALDKANSAKRCGANTKTTANTCKSPAMSNGKCRMHGGKSTGAPCGKAHGCYKHGKYTNKSKQHKKIARYLIQNSNYFCKIPKAPSDAIRLEDIDFKIGNTETINDIKNISCKAWDAMCNQELSIEEAQVIYKHLNKISNQLIKKHIANLIAIAKKKRY